MSDVKNSKPGDFTELQTVETVCGQLGVDKPVEEEEREQFGSTLEFFFSTLGYAGNFINNFKINLYE